MADKSLMSYLTGLSTDDLEDVKNRLNGVPTLPNSPMQQPMTFDAMGNVTSQQKPEQQMGIPQFDAMGKITNAPTPEQQKPPLMAPLQKEVPQTPQMLSNEPTTEELKDSQKSALTDKIASNTKASNPPRTPVSKEAADASKDEEDNLNDVNNDSKKLEDQYAQEDKDAENMADMENQPEMASKPASLTDRLKSMQDAANMSRLTNELGKAGELIGSSIAGTKPIAQGLFDQNIANAGQGVKDLEQEIAIQKDDPESEYSKSAREFLKNKFDVDLPEGISAAQMDKTFMGSALKSFESEENRKLSLQKAQEAAEAKKEAAEKHSEDLRYRYDTLNQMKQQAADLKAQHDQDKEDAKKEIEDTKRIDKLSKELTEETASGRSAFGIAAKNKQAVQNVEALLQGRDPNSLDPREVYETARVLDRVLSQGGATIGGSAKLTPETASQWIAHAKEYILNERQGANAGSFIQQFQKTFDRERNMAEQQVRNTQAKRLSHYRDLADNPRFQDMVAGYGINPDDLQFNKKAGQKSSMSSGQKVRVTNGQEVLEIPADKVQDAAKDKYYPIQQGQ